MDPADMSAFETGWVEARLRAEIERLTRRHTDLERLNQDLEQFVVAANHDLHEPLRMISN
jgi:light-regulated signal transduction histidine kinase (bacteriophytochrome)